MVSEKIHWISTGSGDTYRHRTVCVVIEGRAIWASLSGFLREVPRRDASPDERAGRIVRKGIVTPSRHEVRRVWQPRARLLTGPDRQVQLGGVRQRHPARRSRLTKNRRARLQFPPHHRRRPTPTGRHRAVWEIPTAEVGPSWRGEGPGSQLGPQLDELVPPHRSSSHRATRLSGSVRRPQGQAGLG